MKQKQWPPTVEEAVGVVITALSDEERARITDMAQTDLVGLNVGLGTWIRNNLRDRVNRHLKSN